ncbi:MAG TPA: replicative DNA helicase [Candidatus Paceibacterota bacterium]|nr:replicative DNA helicase [Candidatus Paceibacterota bacterium]
MNQVAPDKLPPQNLDAEKSLLGALLIDKEAVNKIADITRPEDFYQYNHQLIYKAVSGLFDKREPIDLLSLSNKLSEMGVLEQIGGMAYLTSLAAGVPTSAHIASYAKIVQRKKMLRDLIDAAHHIIGLGYREEDDVENLLDEAEKKLFAVSQKSLTKNFLDVGSTLDEAIVRITSQQDGSLRGHKTGYLDLDNTLGGLQRSDLIILAARPSVGKTAFAVNLAYNVAKLGVPVGIFSMEMSIDQVADRFIALASGVSLWDLRTGRLSHDGDDLLRVTMACDELKQLPLYIDDSPAPNILQMRAMARRLQAEHGLGLLVVDYLQLMSARKNYDSMVNQVTEISRGLKGLAKELNIPIIALSQLSRAIEERGGKPKLSDLRDSGSIEQDADLVMFIHREDKMKSRDQLDPDKENKAELIIAKHRNGPTGEIKFRIDPTSLRFHVDTGDGYTDEYLSGGQHSHEIEFTP